MGLKELRHDSRMSLCLPVSWQAVAATKEDIIRSETQKKYHLSHKVLTESNISTSFLRELQCSSS
jgi:hypothetical protein